MDGSTAERTISERLPVVLLFHEVPPSLAKASGRGSHWDLMIATDDDGLLRTWALDELPDLTRSDAFLIAARSLPDHRRDYLEYEGPVSGNRGSVSRVAAGTATWKRKTLGAEEILLRLENDRTEERSVWAVEFANSGDGSAANFKRLID